MDQTKPPGVWRQAAVRCPYCVELEDFRPMVDLTDLPGGPAFCTKCHHVAHPGESGFKCLCRNCRNLDRPGKTATTPAPRRVRTRKSIR